MKQILRSEDFLQRAMDKFSKTVYALAFSQMHSRTDAEDICQDVFLRLLEDTTVFRDDEHLKAWLLRVTLNRCRDHFRLAFNRRRVSLKERPDAGEQEPFEDDLWVSIQTLPPKLRAVVHLYYGEKYSCTEISEILQCSCAAVHSRLHRARKILKLELTEPDTSNEEKGEQTDGKLVQYL